MPKPRRDLTGPPRVVLYTRVSTGEQADSGAGLAAQESQLRAEAERRGWLVVGLLSDAGASGSSMRKRPALADALALVDHGQGDVLAVAKLDRLSRSVLDFAQLMVRARDLGWGLVALDLGVDTTTTSGRLVANVMVSVAEWERDFISQRTREGLADARHLAGTSALARVGLPARGTSLRNSRAGWVRPAHGSGRQRCPLQGRRPSVVLLRRLVLIHRLGRAAIARTTMTATPGPRVL